jgi:hypothetical protein
VLLVLLLDVLPPLLVLPPASAVGPGPELEELEHAKSAASAMPTITTEWKSLVVDMGRDYARRGARV